MAKANLKVMLLRATPDPDEVVALGARLCYAQADIEALRERLEGRGTDSPEVINDRLARATYELSFAPKFDAVVINDDLATAQADALRVVSQFLQA